MGGGSQWRPFIHVKDSVDAMIKILQSPIEMVGRNVFNLGSNSMNYRIADLATLVRSCFSDVAVEVAPDDADKRSYRVDFSKIQDQLGFSGKYSPEYGVKEIIEANKKGQCQRQCNRNDIEGINQESPVIEYFFKKGHPPIPLILLCFSEPPAS